MGHACGPDSEELRTAVREVDAAVCSFLKKLEDLDLARKVKTHGVKLRRLIWLAGNFIICGAL